jgi:hypothetical protein
MLMLQNWLEETAVPPYRSQLALATVVALYGRKTPKLGGAFGSLVARAPMQARNLFLVIPTICARAS